MQVALASLLERAGALAAEAGIDATWRGGDATTDAVIASAQRILDRVDAIVVQARRREELVAEDAVLAAEESACAQSREDVDRAERAVANLEVRLRTVLKAGGISVADADAAAAVAGVRHASERRRSHDAARRRLDEIQRSILALGGDATTLENLETALADQLHAMRWRSRRRARGHATRRCGAAGARPRGGAGATRGVICRRPGARTACAARRRAGHAARDRRPRGRARRL